MRRLPTSQVVSAAAPHHGKAGAGIRRFPCLLAVMALAWPGLGGTVARAATPTARTAMPVSAMVIGGCTASLTPSVAGGAHVGCSNQVPFSVYTVEDGPAFPRVVVVQY